MSFARFSCGFFLLSFSLLLQTIFGTDPNFHICSSTTFNPNEPYAPNLDHLVRDLNLQSPPTGFGMMSVGQDKGQVYGLAQCKSGIRAEDCKTCIEGASSTLRNLCPSNKGAVAWYDNCMFKYSDQPFFRSIDYDNNYNRCNEQITGDNTQKFHKRKDAMFRQLISKVQVSPNLSATNNISLGRSGQRLYALGQCTQDLSPTSCRRCLNRAIRRIRSFCDKKIGGVFANGSCNIRYELYSFF